MRKIFVYLLMAVVLLSSGQCLAEEIKPQKSAFGWGVEVGSSIDMTAHDLSTINLDAYFGYRNSWIDMLGVGGGMHMVADNPHRVFPLYCLMRTSFCKKPSLCFMDLRIGTVINDVTNGDKRARLYFAPGVGFNLSRSKQLSTYITLSYEFNGMREYVNEHQQYDIDNLHMAMVKIGINF